MMLDAIINDRKGKDFNVCIAERPIIPTPEQEIERINVDGRDGNLTKKKGFKDISFPVEFNLLEEINIKGLLRQIKAWLINAKTLQFTDDTVYYKVKNVKIGDIENEVDFYGYFTVEFECDPFQYQSDIETIILTSGSDIKNPGTYFSRPRITVYGNGDTELYINSERITLKSVDSFIVIDSMVGNAYKASVNMNNRMTGNFPFFEEGTNTISFSNNVTKIEIEPRWRYI